MRIVEVDVGRAAALLRRVDPCAGGVALAGEGLAGVGAGSIVLDHEGRIAGAWGGAEAAQGRGCAWSPVHVRGWMDHGGIRHDELTKS